MSRQSISRWLTVATLFLLILALAEFALLESARQPKLGLDIEQLGDQFVVSRVQAAGLASDAGVRAGDTVIQVDDQDVALNYDPLAMSAARSLQVSTSAGGRKLITIQQASLLTEQRRVGFTMLVFCFMLLGSLVFLMAEELLPAGTLLGLAFSASAGLLAALATSVRAPWAQFLVPVGLLGASTCCFLFFLVFPINRLNSRWGRLTAVACLSASLVVLLACFWVYLVDSSAYLVVKASVFAIVTLDLFASCALSVVAVRRASPLRGQARNAFTLIALGAIAGLLPFCLLSLVPSLLGGDYLLPPDISILSIVLVPASLGMAVLDRQFPGVRVTVQRGLVALGVWLTLVAVYGGTIGTLVSQPVSWTMLALGIVVGTFPILEGHLRQRVERLVFRDIYDLAQTLQTQAAEIVTMTDLSMVAEHVLNRLANILDLQWAALRVAPDDTQPLEFRHGDCPPSIALAQIGLAGVPSELGSEDLVPVAGQAPYVVTLIAESVSVGSLIVGPKRRNVDLTPEDRMLIATLSPLIATALRNHLLVRSLQRQVVVLRDRENALAALSTRLINVQEEERRRIALDIHDDPLQRTLVLGRMMGASQETPQTREWQRFAEEISTSLRAICSELRPSVLDDFGLVPALERLINDARARSDLTIEFELEPPPEDWNQRFEAGLETALYRITQEALANCLKHAQATRIVVTLQQANSECIRVAVTDNGVGSDTYETDGNERMGIVGMRERLRQWNGTLSVGMQEGGGTMLVAQVALKQQTG
ncbi:MAG: GAF domain-containing sensor histidine kinase [Chloroflexota bacterium]